MPAIHHRLLAILSDPRTAILAGLVASLGLVSCTPTVNIATPEPVVIDVNVKADITTRTDDSGEKKKKTSGVDAALDRRQRLGEVQNLKNDRVVGENKNGYLSIIKMPKEAQYADYAQRIVEEENKDRETLYLTRAGKEGEPLELVEREYATLWREHAFPGEWIQLNNDKWVQK